MSRSVPSGSPRMFASNFFERFSRAHPLTPAVLYLPLASYAFLTSLGARSLSHALVGVLGGYISWTLTEYWLHRTLFHLPVVGPKTARIAFVVHGVHHERPSDESRLVMPAGASLVLCGLTYALFRGLLGVAMWAPFAGFVLGYVVYDELHWYLHAGRPRTRLGRWLRREHMLHHFKDPASRFGVSCPWLDYLFGSHSRGPDRARPSAAEPAE